MLLQYDVISGPRLIRAITCPIALGFFRHKIMGYHTYILPFTEIQSHHSCMVGYGVLSFAAASETVHKVYIITHEFVCQQILG